MTVIQLQKPIHTEPLKQRVKLPYAVAMTTCLAAICDRHQRIVVVADQKLSLTITAAKGHKIHGVHRDWAVLYAGYASPCIKAIDTIGTNTDHLPKSSDQMLQILTDACLQVPCVGKETRSLLLAGFEGTSPRLFVLEDSARTKTPKVDCWDDPGYVAIGTGSFIALHLMGMYKLSPYQPLAETVYSCCAAKFFSEEASDIGPDTEVYALFPGGVDVRPMSLVAQIRRAWEQQGQLHRPKGIIMRLNKQLAPF